MNLPLFSETMYNLQLFSFISRLSRVSVKTTVKTRILGHETKFLSINNCFKLLVYLSLLIEIINKSVFHKSLSVEVWSRSLDMSSKF